MSAPADLVEQPLQYFPELVFALVDNTPGDQFLLGVYRTKEGAEQEAREWPGPSRIEIVELEG